jgi:hypothetical protein
MKKYIVIFFLVALFYLFGHKLINKYWFPQSIQKYLVSQKFEEGDCLSADKVWGVNPKRVLGMKYKNNEIFYLLIDVDRYEEHQLMDKNIVERYAQKIYCQ